MPMAAPICFWMKPSAAPELVAHLGNGVRLAAAADFAAALDALKDKTVLVDPATAAAAIFDRLNKAGAKVKQAADPCQLPKACKNPLEIEGTRKAHIRDGAALARFLGLVRARGAQWRADRNRRRRNAGRLSPRHRIALPICPSIPFPARAPMAPSCITA